MPEGRNESPAAKKYDRSKVEEGDRRIVGSMLKQTRPVESAAQDRRRWYVPRSFRVGKSRKVHVGVQRRGDTIILACGMAGYIGSDWLIPTDDPHEEVTCGHCLRATT